MRLARTFVVWCLAGAVAGLGALVVAPRLFDVTPYTVLTGSMQPSLGVGDVVLSERRSPLSVGPGDIVTFRDPSRHGELVTHRVESMRRVGGEVAFVTKGDANDVAERWTVAVDGTIGRATMRIPKVGFVVQWASSREGKLGLIAIPAALLVLVELAGLLGLRRRPATEAAA